MSKIYSVDLETTVNDEETRVWLWGAVEVYNTDNFIYGNNIDSLFDFMRKEKNATMYFHNLKFDGDFLMNYLFKNGFKLVVKPPTGESKKYYDVYGNYKNQFALQEDTRTFTTLISDMGAFYSIKVIFEKKNKKTIYTKIYDSLKLFPNFSVDKIAKAFDLPYKKLTLDYEKERAIDHIPTAQEIEYLKHDIIIIALALEKMFDKDLKKMTIGSNALADFKKMFGDKNFERHFPLPDYDKDVRQAYKGGFTYLNPLYKNKDLKIGLVLDVNSLYPDVMYNSLLPYGEPIGFDGNYFDGDKDINKSYPLFIQMLTCQFELKDGYIPTIQLKGNLNFIPNEYVESSKGEEITMCLTSVDLELFLKHYNVTNIIYHCGWKFQAKSTMFRKYIDKWSAEKIKATKEGNAGMRTISKLMLNSLYGKFSTNPKAKSKIPYYDNDKICFVYGDTEERKPLYIPVGEFITAWARYKTITAAQKLYKYFVYADTDSLHLNLSLPNELNRLNNKALEKLSSRDLKKFNVDVLADLDIHPSKLGAWKIEEKFERARYIRQKCYIHDLNPESVWNDKDNYDRDLLSITCAGMPDRCYQFVTWENFKPKAEFKGKLAPKRIKGGIVLKESEYTIR